MKGIKKAKKEEVLVETPKQEENSPIANVEPNLPIVEADTLEDLINYAIEMNEKSFGIMYGANGEQKKIIGNKYVSMEEGLYVEAELKARALRQQADLLKFNITK